MTRARLLAACLLVCAVQAGAQAQGLADPTRPPPEALRQAGAADAEAPVAGPRLQSVLVGEGGRRVAVIDGQTVRLGEKYQGAVLVEVGKNKVVLQRGAAKQVLTLYPETGGKTAAHQR
ncbi:MSHA biogenesis protein MshK [Oxalobacteraceae bacterium A2-2]